MLFKKRYCIDLGSDTIKVYSQKQDKLIKEKNMIAIMDEDKYLACGNDAFEMFEKTARNVRVLVPMSEGMLADLTNLEIILYNMLEKAGKHIGRKPELYFAVPEDLTEIERRAYNSVARTGELSGAQVLLVERPVADAIALGISIPETQGDMIINIGAQSTEISVFADKRVILSRVIPLGGCRMDEMIIECVRRRHQMIIGYRTAMRLKLAMGNLEEDRREARIASGISTLTGLPVSEAVASETVNEAIELALNEIEEAIRSVIERTPPQVRRAIKGKGFHLCGGTSAIPGLDRCLGDALDYPVILSSFTDEGTIQGLIRIMNDKELKKKWTAPAVKVRREIPSYRW